MNLTGNKLKVDFSSEITVLDIKNLSYCPFCDMAKNALRSVGAEFKVMEIEDMPECQEIQDHMQKLTGARSVPRVFINEKFVGGGSEMKAYLEKGQLADMCK